MEAVQRLNCSSFQLGDGAPHELTLSEVTIGGALGPLLDALLRPDCRLGSLELFECEFDPEAPCPRLAPLTQLELTACRCHGSAAWVPELAWQTPALLSLTIDNTISDGDGQETYNWDDEEEVDLEAVAHLTLLTRLKLCALQMGSLPPGPYLQGERSCIAGPCLCCTHRRSLQPPCPALSCPCTATVLRGKHAAPASCLARQRLKRPAAFLCRSGGGGPLSQQLLGSAARADSCHQPALPRPH